MLAGGLAHHGPMAKVGRPSEYDPKVAELILERHANGESIRSICADDSMPKASTLGKWRAAHPEFDIQYMHARQLSGEAASDQAEEYAKRTHHQLPNGMFVPADPTRDRLIVDTLKWRAAKLFPKDYGDKQFVEHSGSISFNDQSDEDLIERMRELLGTGRVALPDGYELVELDEEDHSDLA